MMIGFSHAYTAIIVRSFLPVRHTLALLSQEYGHHQVITRAPLPVVQGALCLYHIHEQRGRKALDRQELMYLPQEWVFGGTPGNLSFMHHILELIHVMVPLEHSPEGLFEHLLKWYEPLPEGVVAVRYQRLFVCRLFSLLGIYPEDSERYDKRFLCLISAPIDIMLNMQETIFYHSVDGVDDWIRGCVQAHPRGNVIKTDFL